MNRQIVKLFGLHRRPLRGPDRLHVLLVGLRRQGAEGKGRQQAAAARAAADPARPHPRRRRHRDRHARCRRATAPACATCAAIPEGSLFGHPIGYSFVAARATASSSSSTTTSWSANESEFSSILDELRGAQARKATTSSPTSTRRRSGSALADLEEAGLRRRGRDRTEHRPGQGDGLEPALRPQPGPLRTLEAEHERNRNAAARTAPPRASYPPGSTFKVVTAAAGLDSGTITPETTIDAPGTLEVEGTPLRKRLRRGLRADHPRHGADQLGQHLVRPARPAGRPGHAVRIHGKVRLQLDAGDRPARRRGLRRAASSNEDDELLAANDPVDLARVAIGQERLLATPLQMAEVAAAVANGGKLMKPQIWSRVVDPDGRVVDKRLDPSAVQPADQRQDRRRADHGDGRRGQRRHRHQRGDLRRPGRRQDRHRGNPRQRSLRRRRRREPGLVHRLRARPTTRRSRSRPRSSAPNEFGNDVAAPIFRDVAETILNGE